MAIQICVVTITWSVFVNRSLWLINRTYVRVDLARSFDIITHHENRIDNRR